MTFNEDLIVEIQCKLERDIMSKYNNYNRDDFEDGDWRDIFDLLEPPLKLLRKYDLLSNDFYDDLQNYHKVCENLWS